MTRVFFGTNRKPNRKIKPTDFGKNFSDAGLGSLRFGEASLEIEHASEVTLRIADEKLVKDAGRKQKDGKGSKLGSLEVFGKVKQSMLDNACDTLVFIHGYNVSFRDALLAATRMKRNLASLHAGKGLNLVLFSWPSDGSMMPYIAYANDRQDAAASGPAFARGFMKLADFLRGATPEESCQQRLHLVAHSMGNYVLRHALQEILRQSPGRPPRLFEQILLMAADEDDDAFEKEHKLKFLPRIAKRVNVYFNNNDKAMAVSDKTKGNPDRLGDDGPRLPRAIPGKVSLIDCTEVVEGILQHSYYLENAVVIRDMASVLAGVRSSGIGHRRYDQENNTYHLLE